jgi:hypothetical protein
MTDVYFHCTDDGYMLGRRRGVAIDGLTEAFEHADRIVRSYVMTPGAEDWRNWVLHATDEIGAELFTVPFASVLGKLH